jgi:hypothetical protein
LLSGNKGEKREQEKLTLFRIVHFFVDGNNLYFFVHGKRRGIFFLYNVCYLF